MRLRPEVCYRAVSSRDPRFDGRFFTGVISTGIYCRPICPARTPKLINCLRCRPELSPWTPQWRGTAATVTRALRLIEEGALDESSVEDLAHKLGVGDRQLRRLFSRELGASPHSVASTRRLQFAKKLIDETRLPMTQVAFAAGFASVRRFNEVVRMVYGCAATALRKQSTARLERLGIVASRARAIRTVAGKLLAGEPLFDRAQELDAVVDRLAALPGLGPWTAQVIAMRALGDPDVRKVFLQMNESVRERDIIRRTETWRPWRAYATFWLWTSLADLQGKRRKAKP